MSDPAKAEVARGRGPLGDFRPGEVVLSFVVAFGVFAAAAIALRVSALDRPAVASEIDKGIAVPVKVIPMLDMDTPLLKLGGKRDPMKLPDRWVRQTPKPRVEQKAHVSTKAGKTEADIPPPDVKVADAGTPPPPPDAEIVKKVETPITEVIDAGPPANVDQKGHADGVKEGTEEDPLKARAVDLYRQRLRSWFSSRFRVSGSGLGPDEITKIRVGASVQITPDLRVSGYSMNPSGNAAFDAAAKAMLEGAKGQTLPSPPENYPDVVQGSINITLVCTPKTCD
jgi:hypothetical protein